MGSLSALVVLVLSRRLFGALPVLGSRYMLGGSWNSVALVLWRLPYWSALSLRSSGAFGRRPLGRSPGFCEPVGPCLGLVCRVGGPWGPWTCDSQASPVIPPCSFWAGSSLWSAVGATRRLSCCGRRVPPGVLCFLFRRSQLPPSFVRIRRRGSWLPTTERAVACRN